MSVGSLSLRYMSRAAIEIIVVIGIPEDRHAPFWECAIHQFGDRAMEILHHRAQIGADFEIPDRVVVLHRQGRFSDSGDAQSRRSDPAGVSKFTSSPYPPAL